MGRIRRGPIVQQFINSSNNIHIGPYFITTADKSLQPITNDSFGTTINMILQVTHKDFCTGVPSSGCHYRFTNNVVT